jgi:anti-sigma B factor antagonist
MLPAPNDDFLEITRVGQVAVAKFVPILLWEEELVRNVGERLNQVVAEVGSGPLVLDFTQVSHVSSSMVAKLIGVRHRVQAAGGKLALCGIRPELFSLFELTGLNQVFRIYRDASEAAQNLE